MSNKISIMQIKFKKCARTQVPPPPTGARNVTSAPCRAVMMAVRERAVKVMAAPERRVPGLDDFVGQSWSAWTERATLTASEGSNGDEYSKNGKTTTETMTLRKEDMSIFGNFPGHDDFYLVVCGHCSQVVKPQAFEKHCERRHGPLGKLYAHLRSTPPPPQQHRSRHGHTLPSHGASSWSGRNQNVGPLWASPQSPSTPPQFRHTKPPKDGVWHSPSNSGHSESAVFKQSPLIEPTRSSPPPTQRDPPWPHGGPSPNRPSSTERPQSQRGEAALAPAASGHLRGSRTYKMVSKKYLKHQILTPRVPQPSLQPFLPLLPPFPSIPNRKQEVTTQLLSRLPSTLPTDQARSQTCRVPRPAAY
ncbi:ataxin-7-like protein 2 [Sinocyclocheilus grahami]|uniref:ataxin-7-like protein 2 n=1 Tax=Sinocyclocheilus grahami TaxID=75366 RepID=UPI0007AD5A74|nr:PREDICTED: ataxin-7-like protein 2 [Sinocyclocheilus grahami]